MIIIIIIRKSYNGANSLRLTRHNCLAGSGLQPAPTRYRGGLKRIHFSSEPAPTRFDTRRIFNRVEYILIIFLIRLAIL